MAPERALPAGLLLLLAAAGAGPVRAQGFGDYEHVGRLADARQEPSPLQVGPHSFPPTIVTRLLDLTTPHVFGSAELGYVDNLLRGDPETPGVPLVYEPFGRFEGGARLDTALSDHRLELDYRAVVTEYIRTSQYDTLEQRARARLDLLFTDVELHGDGGWTRSAYPQSIQLRGIVRLETYDAHAWVEARLGRFGARLGLRGTRLDYRERALRYLDARLGGLDAQLYGRVSPKLRALLEYNLNTVRYDQAQAGSLNDTLAHQLRAGVDGDLSPKVNASLKVGASLLQAERGPNADRRDFLGFTAEASLRWRPWSGSSLGLAYARVLEPSTSSNFLVTDRITASVDQGFLEETVKLGATCTYSYSHVAPGENLSYLTAGATASWRPRDWLSFAAQYTFENLISTYAFSDYQTHTVTISVGVGF